MKTYDPSEPLIGLHIPKTGGTSLREILQEWFSNKQLFLHYRTPPGLPEPHSLKGATCAYGHFNGRRGFGVADYYPQVQQFFCFVREPFDRIVSLWFYMNHKKQSTDRRSPILAGDPSFETWLARLADHEFAHETDMVAFLPLGLGSDSIGDLLERHFIFVGTMERFGQSADCLADILGKPRIVLNNRNKSPRTDTDLEKWRPFFEKHFQDDMEFYEIACRINSRMLAAWNDGRDVASSAGTTRNTDSGVLVS